MDGWLIGVCGVGYEVLGIRDAGCGECGGWNGERESGKERKKYVGEDKQSG